MKTPADASSRATPARSRAPMCRIAPRTGRRALLDEALERPAARDDEACGRVLAADHVHGIEDRVDPLVGRQRRDEGHEVGVAINTERLRRAEDLEVHPWWDHGDPALRISERDEVVTGGLDGADHEVRTEGPPGGPRVRREAVERLVRKVLPGHDRLAEPVPARIRGQLTGDESAELEAGHPAVRPRIDGRPDRGSSRGRLPRRTASRAVAWAGRRARYRRRGRGFGVTPPR